MNAIPLLMPHLRFYALLELQGEVLASLNANINSRTPGADGVAGLPAEAVRTGSGGPEIRFARFS